MWHILFIFSLASVQILDSLSQVWNAYNKAGEYEALVSETRGWLYKAVDDNDTVMVLKSGLAMAQAFIFTEQFDSVETYLGYIQKYETAGMDPQIGVGINTIRGIYSVKSASDYSRALRYYYEGLSWAEREGNVTAVSTGTAEITLTIDSKSDVCKVTVDPVLPQDIVFDVTEHRLLVGGSFKINATVLPEDADDKSLEWSSSDESVAVVADDGTVSAVAAGSAVITALCGEITAECVVTVIPMPQLGDYYYSDGTWSTELDASKETIGLVFYITPDYTSGKILSLDEFYNPEGGEYASYTKWCTGEMEYVGCSHEFEGRLNMEIMKEHPGWEENYPPFKWCADKTDGGLEWYLPATAELRQMLCGMVGYKWMSEGAEEENNEINDWGDNERYLNGSEYADEKEAFNARVVAAGGEPLECGGNMYWASNEQDANYAGKIVFLTGMTQGFKKSDPYGRVRPIAIFTIE